MSEDYEEVYDRTKVFALIIGLVSVGVLVVFFLTVDLEQIVLPEIEIPKIEIPVIQLQEQTITEPQIPDEIEPGKDAIKDDYFKYLDFGLSMDDIVDIQSMPCSVFSSSNNTLSTEGKYQNIFDQRRLECEL